MRQALKRLYRVFVARNIEFFRDRAAMGWSLVFPFLLVIAFSLAFDEKNQILYKVGWLGSMTDSKSLLSDPDLYKYIQFVEQTNQEESLKKLKHHHVDLVFDSNQSRAWYNTESPKSVLLYRIFAGSSKSPFEVVTISRKTLRYVDWVMPGILAMNMMFIALFGLGYVLVLYKQKGILKRIKATPIRSWEFLLAQVASRLLVVFGISALVFIGAKWVVGFTMIGSYLKLFAVFLVGTLCLISLGLIISCRTRNKELADGILNVLAWPMMIGSGVWFSLEGAGPLLKTISKIFPLTYIVESLRGVMLEDTSWVQLMPNITVLCFMTVLFFSLGSFFFKWD